MTTSILPLRAAIAQHPRVLERYRKQLLRQHDFVLLAIVELCRAEPDWSAGRVSAALQGTCPGLQERLVAELRMVIGAKHSKRRGGKREARGPLRARLRIGACGYVLGGWYRGRERGAEPRQLIGAGIDEEGKFVIGYSLAAGPSVFRTSYHSWVQWVDAKIPASATPCRTEEVPGYLLTLQTAQERAVECEAA